MSESRAESFAATMRDAVAESAPASRGSIPSRSARFEELAIHARCRTSTAPVASSTCLSTNRSRPLESASGVSGREQQHRAFRGRCVGAAPPSGPRGSWNERGWDGPLERFGPLLSYDELDPTFSTPNRGAARGAVGVPRPQGLRHDDRLGAPHGMGGGTARRLRPAACGSSRPRGRRRWPEHRPPARGRRARAPPVRFLTTMQT